MGFVVVVYLQCNQAPLNGNGRQKERENREREKLSYLSNLHLNEHQ